MKDVMIDLETLGTGPDAVVISIGAVFFDIENKTTGVTFYAVADIDEQLERGRKPTGDTIKWWLGQSDSAKKVFNESARPMARVLTEFAMLYHVINPKGAYVWSNGSTFDITIMENLFKDYGLPIPWSYNKTMDLRTFKRFKGNGKPIVKQGVAHNALDDALSQALYVLDNS